MKKKICSVIIKLICHYYKSFNSKMWTSVRRHQTRRLSGYLERYVYWSTDHPQSKSQASRAQWVSIIMVCLNFHCISSFWELQFFMTPLKKQGHFALHFSIGLAEGIDLLRPRFYQYPISQLWIVRSGLHLVTYIDVGNFCDKSTETTLN